MTDMYTRGLEKTPANYTPMTPLSFIQRAASVYPNHLAIVHGTLRQDWQTTYQRCIQLASALVKHGVQRGDTVAVMLPNTPPMVEAHFGVPMAGAVLNSLNTRLDPEAIAFMLGHGEAKVVIVDPEFSHTMKKALEIANLTDILVIDVQDELYQGDGQAIG